MNKNKVLKMDTAEFEQRILSYRQLIEEKEKRYRENQLRQYELGILKRLPDKFGNIIQSHEQDYWMGKFEEVVKELPEPSKNGAPFVKAKNQLLRDLNKKYKLQRKGQWVSIFMPVFMVSIGVSIGTATDNLALWIPIGMVLGFGVGYLIENQAKKKDLIL